MIIHSSSQVSRIRLLRRFPLPRGFGVLRESRIEPGRHWSAPARRALSHGRIPPVAS